MTDPKVRESNIYKLSSQLRQFARYAVGRVVGSTTATKGSYKFYLQLEEERLIYRAELNVLSRLVLDKTGTPIEEFLERLEQELKLSVKERQSEWPEAVPDETGSSYKLDIDKARKRMEDEKWPP